MEWVQTTANNAQKETPEMTIELISVALIITLTVATAFVTVRDGYRRIPTRKF